MRTLALKATVLQHRGLDSDNSNYRLLLVFIVIVEFVFDEILNMTFFAL